MANLRDIRNRITSINNTKQITNAMKMVAASKLRKAQLRMNATRPYARKLTEVVARLVANTSSKNELLKVPEETGRVLVIVIGSDRGLCGGFNNNLFKALERRLHDTHELFLKEDRLDMVCIGKKAEDYFRKRNYSIVRSFPGLFDTLNYSDAVRIMEKTSDQFVEGAYDQVLLVWNEFKSVISQIRTVRQVLPVDPDQLVRISGLEDDDSEGVIDYLYEPDTEGILESLLPLYLNTQLWSALLESNAAEQGARMAAMDNATENASELEDELRLKYNQARQSAITTEISEIVSGAQALSEE